MIQIWTALITILILKSFKPSAKYNWYLSNLVALIRLTRFVKVDLQNLLDELFEDDVGPPELYVEGSLFSFFEKSI